MKIDELQDGQMLRFRCGRAGAEDVLWQPWTNGGITVQRHTNRVVILGLRDVTWAEYAPSDYDPHHNLFLVEDYYLQIEGLTP
jgi:hypothetical protein